MDWRHSERIRAWGAALQRCEHRGRVEPGNVNNIRRLIVTGVRGAAARIFVAADNDDERRQMPGHPAHQMYLFGVRNGRAQDDCIEVTRDQHAPGSDRRRTFHRVICDTQDLIARPYKNWVVADGQNVHGEGLLFGELIRQ